LSHDVWLYLAQPYLAQRRAFDESFMERFADVTLKQLGTRQTADQVRGLHLIHLIERLALLKQLGFAHKQHEVAILVCAIADMLERP
jgi:hypothetical protein